MDDVVLRRRAAPISDAVTPRIWNAPPNTIGIPAVGDSDGLTLGLVLGLALGDCEGEELGLVEGLPLGLTEGLALGLDDGEMLGDDDGDTLGLSLGACVLSQQAR